MSGAGATPAAPEKTARPGGEPPILRIAGLGKSLGGRQILSGIDLEMARGETVAIVGPSGAGKTTLLRCVNFLTPYDEGRIYLGDELIGYRESGGQLRPAHDAVVARQRRRTGMVFQRFALFPHRNVLGNLIEGPVYVLGLPREAAEARAREALREVGLEGKIDAFPDELSGGQQQRVGIARALCMQPEILLFDEATSALDPELVGEVLAVMRRLSEERRTMLVVTHELKFAREAADRMVFMENGRVVADLPTRTFFEAPPTPRIEAFLRAGGHS
ncbi:amino acid ABC transporter ATP-binding protein [Ancylobacter mangrovi]|uniref:amino acid ABC transporter ATP-binding protein n=1 Tax=Ancylobacter mangrovi TaxID=2972472 RepID=UPI002162FB9C|nr:amino acid ABC transporter ATP-binding protein [Ancylobacter mangrovi]MCS0502161.1 amino acid ABC transporter ATP-binding protein [Ancylobacter mangrovi]